MPIHATKILAGRVLDENGFYRPSYEDEFFAFGYHLCYHKGKRCGIPTGLDIPHENKPARDYFSELIRMAENLGIVLPENLTLLRLHQFLAKNNWSMANDLMERWPDQHDFLKALIEIERKESGRFLSIAERLTVFIVREDCDQLRLQEKVFTMISDRFTIIKKIYLTSHAQARVMSMTRGGNWIEKYKSDPVKPIITLVCLNSAVPGPLPVSMSPSKLSKRYPHLKNTDILIKRVIRTKINKMAPLPFNRLVIHASDNPLDASEALKATLGSEFPSLSLIHI